MSNITGSLFFNQRLEAQYPLCHPDLNAIFYQSGGISNPKLTVIDKSLSPLERIQKAYELLKENIHCKYATRPTVASFYSIQMVKAMEEFVISNASKEALSQEVITTEKSLSARFPNLRVPSFETCIEEVRSAVLSLVPSEIGTTKCLSDIEKASKDFIQFAKEIPEETACNESKNNV